MRTAIVARHSGQQEHEPEWKAPDLRGVSNSRVDGVEVYGLDDATKSIVGIYLFGNGDSSNVVSHCYLHDNQDSGSISTAIYGVFLEGVSNAVVRDCTFVQNTTHAGEQSSSDFSILDYRNRWIDNHFDHGLSVALQINGTVGCIIDGNTFYKCCTAVASEPLLVNTYLTYDSKANVISNNTFYNTGSTTIVPNGAIFVNSTTEQCVITGNAIHSTAGNGIRLAGRHHIFSENSIINSGVYSSLRAGIVCVSLSTTIISGNQSHYDSDAGSTRPWYGLTIDSACAGLDVFDNILIPVSTQASAIKYSAAATSLRIKRNRGWTTENGGDASIAHGTTIAHGLSAIPTRVSLESQSTVPRIVSVKSKSASTFTIGLWDTSASALTGAGTTRAFWYAEV